MKIERLNDNQIRCTLSRRDFVDRHLKMSDIAYGSEKTQALFQDVMRQAFYETGFVSDDYPLMVEAVPLSGGSVILTVTKVDDPEELDTRFAQFSPGVNDTEDGYDGDGYDGYDSDSSYDGYQEHRHLDDGFDSSLYGHYPGGNYGDSKRPSSDESIGYGSDFAAALEHFKQALSMLQPDSDGFVGPDGKGVTKVTTPDGTVTRTAILYRAFRFDSLGAVLQLARVASAHGPCDSSLYKDKDTGAYILLICNRPVEVDASDIMADISDGTERGSADPSDVSHSVIYTPDPNTYNRICNCVTEYGHLISGPSADPEYLREHYELLHSHDALMRLAQI